MNTITFGGWVGSSVWLSSSTLSKIVEVNFNEVGYLLWILDINLKNFVRGYFSKFSLRALSLSDTLLEQRLAKTPIYKIYGSKTLVTLFNLLLNALQRNRSKTKFAICKNYGSRAILQHVVQKEIKDQLRNLHVNYGSKTLISLFTMLHNAVQRKRSKTKIAICKNYGTKTLVILFNLLFNALQRNRS